MLYLVDVATLLLLFIVANVFLFFYPRIYKFLHNLKWKMSRIKVKRPSSGAEATVIPMVNDEPAFDVSMLPKETPILHLANKSERKEAEKKKMDAQKPSLDVEKPISAEEREKILRRVLKVQRYVEAATMNVKRTNFPKYRVERMKNTAYRGYVCPPKEYEKYEQKKEK